MAVWLAQCLCPSRHCLLAVASDALEGQALIAVLQGDVADAVEVGGMDPWCGLCGARRATWTYEVGRTIFATLREAEPALRATEAAQVRSRALLRRLGLAYEPPPGEG